MRRSSGTVAGSTLRGRWQLLISLPEEGRCGDIAALMRAQDAFRKRQVAVAVLVTAAAMEADLIRDASAHHGEPDFLGIVADPERTVAAALGLVGVDGRMQSASVAIDPEGIVCGILRHHPAADRCIDSLLALFDALRAGRAGCTTARKQIHA
jgi:alkyl hydroperoxide reductase subunit AhpC